MSTPCVSNIHVRALATTGQPAGQSHRFRKFRRTVLFSTQPQEADRFISEDTGLREGRQLAYVCTQSCLPAQACREAHRGDFSFKK